MKRNPLVSFCIPTYKRPDLLAETIRSVLNQTYSQIEIIVSDNDPQKSAKPVVKTFRSKKIKYIFQKKNVGMMNNFGKAFDQSRGDYIVFLGDDDPIEPNMIEILMELRNKYPDAGSYFGAPFLLTNDALVLKLHKIKRGKTSMRNKNLEKGVVRIYTPSQFLSAFLNYQIFSYFFWSCGMVRRDVVKAVGKAHNLYGSDLLTDYAYVLRVGTKAKVSTINTEVGTQRIHGGNYGRTNESLLTLGHAVKGFYEENKKKSEKYCSKSDLEKFIRNWTVAHLFTIVRFRKIKREHEDKMFFVKLYINLAIKFSFLRIGFPIFCFRIILPSLAKTYDDNKWIFERRTIQKAVQKLLKK